MNGLAWAGGVCMAAAGCTLLHLFVGKTGVGKVFRLLTAAFFICAVLVPLSEVLQKVELPSLQSSSQTAADLQQTAKEQLCEMTEQVLLQEVNTVLQSHDLSAQKIEIEMDTLSDGRISITDIVVYIPSGNTLHRNWVKEIVTQRLGTEVRVVYAD